MQLVSSVREILDQNYLRLNMLAISFEIIKKSFLKMLVILSVLVMLLFLINFVKLQKIIGIETNAIRKKRVFFIFHWLGRLKNIFLIITICLLFCFFVFFLNNPNKETVSPNIILIVIDTLRADHLSCYGYERNTTPNIDELANEAIVFEKCYSVAPWTTPSIGSLFTAQYASVLGIKKEPVKLKKNFLTLAEVLNEYGYETKGIISHLFISSKLNFNQGFSSFDEENIKDYKYVSSPSITAKAISFIKSNLNNKFFLFLHYFDPHNDYILHKEYNYFPDYKGPFYSGQGILELRKFAPRMSRDDVEFIKSLYDSEISFTDLYIGKLINWLKKVKLYNKTLLVLTADHGEEFLERGDYYIGHAKTLYKELIHVPLIIKLPYQCFPARIKQAVSLVDLMPTILDIVGLKIPKNYKHSGKIIKLSNSNIINYERDTIFFETKRLSTLIGVVKGKWKCILNLRSDKVSLYDLEKDPLEKINLSQEFPQISQELVQEINKWRYFVLSRKVKREKVEFTDQQKEILRSLGYIK